MSKVIPPLQKGKLRDFGYSVKEPATQRHKALDKAVKEYGATSVARKLTAVATLQKNTNPKASSTFKKDEKYVMRKKKD